MSIGIPNPRPTFQPDNLRQRQTFAPRLDANDANVRTVSAEEYEAECGPSLFSYDTMAEAKKAQAEWRAQHARDKQEEEGERTATGIRGFFRRLLGKK